MTLYNTKDLLTVANQKGGFAVGAFNVHNMEFTQGVIKAAELEDAPAILMIGEPMIAFFGLEMIIAICKSAASTTKVPVAIALDHGKKMENINRCLELGVSVMYDGSHHGVEENIRITREVVEKAHKLGLPVEGELGSIGGAEDTDEITPEKMTDPDAAAEFVKATGIDILAIAIGNAHGLYRHPPKLDVARLIAIRKKVSIPVVLHGGSDLPEQMARDVITNGITKFNIGTDLKYAFSRKLKETVNADPMPFQPPAVMGPAREAVCEVARAKMRLFGSSGKAGLFGK